MIASCKNPIDTGHLRLGVRRFLGGARQCLAGGPLVWAAWMTVAVVATSALAAPPDLGGDWRLNEEMSDDVTAYFQQAINNQPPRRRQPGRDSIGDGTGVGGLSGSAGGFPVGRTPRVSERDASTLLDRMQELAEGFETLSINVEAPMLSIVLANNRRRSFRIDGKRTRKDTVDGTQVTSAKLKKDGRLVVITSSDFGREVTETFELLPETDQLSLTTELHPVAGMPAVTVHRIYDRTDITASD